MRRILTPTFALVATVALVPAARADFGSDSWWKSFTFSGYIDAGLQGNTTGSTAGTNYGRLFDDCANRPELNQFSLLATGRSIPTPTISTTASSSSRCTAPTRATPICSA